ncbi:hypothetical protein O3G_MSEX012814 [Manduca sexta]|uniref:Uncharacterized protein n=1 Tax=Manduca sexta TaxID=7130 RepID=A0A921ZPZ3_MANSE|nr:hypothetical protein O3G_MSEX012814 [Manduca sexta]
MRSFGNGTCSAWRCCRTGWRRRRASNPSRSPPPTPCSRICRYRRPWNKVQKKTMSGLEEEKPYDGSDIDTAVAWEDEDFANDVELTEEQQTLLLEEYEKEIASKKISKQSSFRDVINNNPEKISTDNSQTTDKMNNKLTVDKKNKNGRSPKKPAKTDVCGNNLVEDYFGDKEVKDDASANSDESWEKDFEVDDVVEQKA